MSTFKYYWVVNIILTVLGWVISLGALINIISIVYNIICLGWILKKFYARIDNREEEDVKVLAYVSAFSVLYIIAVVKFLGIKNTKEY